jgi:low temperature requirement protein LtrA
MDGITGVVILWHLYFLVTKEKNVLELSVTCLPKNDLIYTHCVITISIQFSDYFFAKFS